MMSLFLGVKEAGTGYAGFLCPVGGLPAAFLD